MFETDLQIRDPYRSGGFLVEPMGSRCVFAPEDLDNTPAAKKRAAAAFEASGKNPLGGLASSCEVLLASLAGGCIPSVRDSLSTLASIPAAGAPRRFKSAAAYVASCLFALESICYRTAGLSLEWLEMNGQPNWNMAAEEFALEFTLVRAFAMGEVSAQADEILAVHSASDAAFGHETTVPRSGSAAVESKGRVLDRSAALAGWFRVPEADSFPALAGIVKYGGSGRWNVREWILGPELVALESAKIITSHVLVGALGKGRPAMLQAGADALASLITQVFVLDSVLGRIHQLLRRRGIEKAKEQLDLAGVFAARSTDGIRHSVARLLDLVGADHAVAAAVDILASPAGEQAPSDGGLYERVTERYFTA